MHPSQPHSYLSQFQVVNPFFCLPVLSPARSPILVIIPPRLVKSHPRRPNMSPCHVSVMFASELKKQFANVTTSQLLRKCSFWLWDNYYSIRIPTPIPPRCCASLVSGYHYLVTSVSYSTIQRGGVQISRVLNRLCQTVRLPIQVILIPSRPILSSKFHLVLALPNQPRYYYILTHIWGIIFLTLRRCACPSFSRLSRVFSCKIKMKSRGARLRYKSKSSQ